MIVYYDKYPRTNSMTTSRSTAIRRRWGRTVQVEEGRERGESERTPEEQRQTEKNED